MRSPSRWILVLALMAATTLAGCMISDQTGQMPQRLPGHGSGYSAPEDITYHFDSTFNWVIVLGRSLLLVVVGAWFFFSVSGTIPRIIGTILGLVAAWLLVQGLVTVMRYSVMVDIDRGLVVSVPPDAAVDIPFETIETLDISGYEWQRAQVAPGFGPNPQAKKLHFTELPDWRTMKLALSDGRSVELDLERLSIEQRQTLLNAIVRYGKLIEE